MDCLGHAFTLPGAVIARGDDARAHGDAVEETHQQKNRGPEELTAARELLPRKFPTIRESAVV